MSENPAEPAVPSIGTKTDGPQFDAFVTHGDRSENFLVGVFAPAAAKQETAKQET